MTAAQTSRRKRNETIRAEYPRLSVARLAVKWKLTEQQIRVIVNRTPEVLQEQTKRRKLARAVEIVRAAGYELREVG
jgi:Mor family transcriptional regulator